MTTPRETAIAQAEQYFDDGHLLADLTRLVAIETESQEPEKAGELRRYLDEAMVPMLQEMGFGCTIHPNPVADGGPILLAQRHESSTRPTVLIYGHGDVIRAQTAQWREGLHPFRLVVEGARAYGRGSADNKVQHLINLQALAALLEVQGTLGFNVKVVIEMSEETGSPGLGAFFEANRAALAADVLIASDGPRLDPRTPTMFMGSRGAVNFDLEVMLREGAHHSGNWGGLLTDPAQRLAHALAAIATPEGALNVPEWRPNSLTPDIREALSALPVGGNGPAINPHWGEPGLSAAEKVFGWNSFAVLAMASGVPDAPVNAIAGHASAHCQLRFVVGTDETDILPALRRFLDARGFEDVRIRPADRGKFRPTRLSPHHPWAQFVANSLHRTSGKAPHLLPNLAGSLPNEAFTDILGLPTVWVPHSYGGCSQHAPDEHVLLPVCREAMALMVGLFWDIANTDPPTPA